MRLAASVMVGPGELDRYLRITVPALLTFCDEVAVRCEGDAEARYLSTIAGVRMLEAAPSFFAHEGQARQELLNFTLAGNPTHVLAVDADEIVTDGATVRAACEADEGAGAWTLCIQEVWKADAGALWLRRDGGWGAQAKSPLLYRAPTRQNGRGWRIPDRQLACGREPQAVRMISSRAVPTNVDVLHFGWSNESERAARYQRYVEHDSGRFHARAHLDSIMWPDRRVRLARRRWPEGMDRDALLARIR